MAAIDGDAIWIPVLPEVTGWNRRLGADVVKPAARAGTDAGTEMGRGIERGVDRSGGRIRGALTRWATRGAVAAGLAAGALLAGGIRDALDAADMRAQMTASMGLTPAQAARAGQAAGSIYRSALVDSAGEARAAVEAVMSSVAGAADMPTRELERVATHVAGISKTFGVEAEKTGMVLQNLVTVGTVRSVTEGADMITAAMQRVPKALRGELLDATEEYAPHLAGIGVTGAAAFDTLTRFAEMGQYGLDKAGDAAKELGIRVKTMDPTAGAALAAIGLDARALARDMAAGGESAHSATVRIATALQSVEDPAERSALAAALMGATIEDLGVNNLPAFLGALSGTGEALGEVTGKADGLAATLTGTPSAALTKFTRGLQGVAADGVGAFVQGLMGAESQATGWARTMWEVGESVGNLWGLLATGEFSGDIFGEGQGSELVVTLQAARAVALELGGALAAVARWGVEHAGTVAALAAGIGTMAAAVGAYRGAMALAHGVEVAWTAATQIATGVKIAWAAAQAAVNVATWAFPGTWIVAAIVGVIAAAVLLWQNWDTVSAKAGELWAWLKSVFGGIGDAMSQLWAGTIAPIGDGVVRLVTRTVPDAFRTGLDAAGHQVDRLTDWVSRGVNAITGALGVARKWITVTLPQAFRSGVRTIGDHWATIKQKMAAPINWVINTVYTGGVKRLFDTVAEKVGSKTRLPKIGPIAERRRGGWTPPGWTLVGEEGPEIIHTSRTTWVSTARETREALARAQGPDALMSAPGPIPQRLRAHTMRGRPTAAGRADQIGDGRGIVDAVAQTARNALASLTDTLASPARALLSVADAAWNASPWSESAWADLGYRALTTPLRNAGEALAQLLGPDTSAGTAGGVWRGALPGGRPGRAGGRPDMTYRALFNTIRSFYPAARMTSGYRPGARTRGYGSASYHSLGRAVDLVAPNMRDLAEAIIRRMGGTLSELLYSPLNGRQINNGRFYYERNPRTRADHWDHVHVAYDAGGWLAPGSRPVENRTGRPEPVFTAPQWSMIRTLAARGAAAPTSPQPPGGTTFVLRDADGAFRGMIRGEAATVAEQQMSLEAIFR